MITLVPLYDVDLPPGSDGAKVRDLPHLLLNVLRRLLDLMLVDRLALEALQDLVDSAADELAVEVLHGLARG